MNRSRGFTLAELMVVIGIIALLVAIIMPSLSSAGSEARRILCLNNLNKINQATQAAASRGMAWNLHAMAVDSGWVSVVQIVTGGSEILKCPEGGPLAEGKPVETLMVIRMDMNGTDSIPLMEVFKDGGWGAGYKLLKFSSTQYSQLGEGHTVTPAPYVPDGNPNLYYWCYDDAGLGGDHDFQDLIIRVTKTGGGTANVFILASTGGNPEVWSPDLKICYARSQDINEHHYGGKGVTVQMNVGGSTHYGMNTARIDMRQFDRIQAMDYCNATAASTDNWSSKEWDVDKDNQPDFLRHRGRLNGVTLGGSAKTYYRWQLDPVDIQIERDLWEK